jgi:tRNA threonylcarbamoyl adenosine modification protein (Sua5/YciO/YrdC/YwlC family)
VTTSAEAATALKDGRPVILPTDTVYGLCVSAYRPDAFGQLAKLKGRGDQPVALLASDLEAILDAVPELRARYAAYAEALLPGGYTLVLPNPARRLPWLSAGNQRTIGIRVPDLPLGAKDVLDRAGAVAATSANRHGEPDPRTLADVPEEIRAAAVAIDGGELPGLASTVVDVTGEEPRILREGAGDAARALDLARSLLT